MLGGFSENCSENFIWDFLGKSTESALKEGFQRLLEEIKYSKEALTL